MQCGDCTRLPSSCRAALLVVLIVGARADVDNSDAMQFLTAMGLPPFLPNLDVKYDIGSWGKKLRVEGAATHVKAPDDVRKAPMVEWPESAESSETVNSKFVMLMVAPDEPMRASKEGFDAGATGPQILWMGVNCVSSVKSCYEAIPYEAPNPAPRTGKHRYIYLLLKQRPGKVPDMNTLAGFLHIGGSRNNWPLADFLISLEESLEPVATAFFYGSREGTEAASAPSGDDAPLRMQPPGGGASGLGPGWAGGKRPVIDAHDEL